MLQTISLMGVLMKRSILFSSLACMALLSLPNASFAQSWGRTNSWTVPQLNVVKVVAYDELSTEAGKIERLARVCLTGTSSAGLRAHFYLNRHIAGNPPYIHGRFDIAITRDCKTVALFPGDTLYVNCLPSPGGCKSETLRGTWAKRRN